MELYLNKMVYIAINYVSKFMEVIMTQATRRFLRGAMVIFSWFVIPYSRLYNIRTPRKKLPPILNPILEINAVTLAHMIRTKQIKSEQVVQAYIDRCKEVNTLLNAIVEERFEKALQEAREIDNLIACNIKTIDEMEKDTPILGLPITVKESIAVKGMMNQGGRLSTRKQIAEADAPCVQQVKKHGGIILLVSNTPELCMCWETYNKVSGLTRNPYDLKRTPGGSSGGEAALLASGASLIGISSDVAGSARLPAMFSGIYGHKPTPYAVSPDGHVPKSKVSYWGDYFTIAPMTRYACDLSLLLKCITDPAGPKLTLDRQVKIEDVKFYYMLNDGPSGTTRPLCTDVRIALEDVAKYFNATAVQLNNLKCSLEMSMSAMLRIKNLETIYFQKDENEPKKKLSTETFRYLFGLSDSTFPSVVVGHLQQAMKLLPESRHKKLASIAESLKNQFKELLGTNGVFLYPTFPTTAHQHYQIYHKIVDASYMMIFNTIGLPATNCMIRLDKKQLPIGIQVITNPGQDHIALAVAAAIEKKFGGWVKPPAE